MLKKILTIFIFLWIILNIWYVNAEWRFLPWTFKWWYWFLKAKPDIINDFFIDIRYNFSILEQLNEWWYTSFYSKIIDNAENYLKSNNNNKNIQALQILKKNKPLILKYIDSIHKLETNNNITFNPNNHQWIYQLFHLEEDAVNCNNNKNNRYTACDILDNIYLPWKELNDEDLMYQTLDFIYYWNSKFWNLPWYMKSENYKINHYSVMTKLFNDLDIRYNDDEIDEFYNLSTNNLQNLQYNSDYNSDILKIFYNKNMTKLKILWFEKVSDLVLFAEFYETALIWSLYNWLWNVWRYVFDNAYISSYPKIWLVFEKCANDWCSYKTQSKQIGLLFTRLKRGTNPNYKKWFIIYSVIIKEIKEIFDNDKI